MHVNFYFLSFSNFHYNVKKVCLKILVPVLEVFMHMGDSRPFRPGCDPHNFFFLSKYVMDDHKTMTYTNFQIFLKVSLAAMFEIVVKFGPLSILPKLTP